jgi:UDP-N-acetylmuramoylalanine--D-glutamate ligase
MKVAIAGYGVEGKASYEYFVSKGNEVTILDERAEVPDLPGGVKAVLGSGAFSSLGEYDMVVRTPSLPPKKLAGAKRIWSATNEFFAQCSAPIIGITGTKGKGTTSSLTAAILQKSGKTVHLVGNIGTPALAMLGAIKPEDIVVYEMSSFQLWDLEKSPHIAVVLMVEPDHLNVHADFEDYAMAKGNIAAHQQATDILIYHPTNETSARIAGLSPAATKLRYQTPEAAHVVNDHVMINGTDICPVNEVGLLGEYNLQNVCAALSASWQVVQNAEAAAQAIRDFKGLEHRLEFVAQKRGVRYFNDSYSSAPTATMGAISAFKGPVVLIAGGYDRGIDFAPLAGAIVKSGNVRKVLAIGQTKTRMVEALQAAGYDAAEVIDVQHMDEIVSLAAKSAEPGDTVLLSPGCASFDMFLNFTERGKAFKKAVGGLHE